MDVKLAKQLTEANALPGYEGEVREIIRQQLREIAALEQDKLGSIIARLPGKSDSPKIMLPAHMDEIGLMVSHITEQGFVKFTQLGGWLPQVLVSHRVVIQTSKGLIPGVIGARAPHGISEEESKKLSDPKHMYIDVGAADKKEAENKFGIRMGDPIIPQGDFMPLASGKLYAGKAFDDRIGCAVMIETLKRLSRQSHPNTVYGVGTVQEEVGARGARTAARVVEPDVAIICEIGLAGDIPDERPEEVTGKLGKGPQICVLDYSMIPNTKLRDLAIEVAEENKIPYQMYMIPRGGTDGGPIHVRAQGVPCLYFGPPIRYAHTATSVIHRDDYDNTIKLLVNLIKRLDEKTVAKLTA